MNGFSLDREAFSFTNYDLNVQVEPEQHRLGVRGKLTLRNDSATPQKVAVLQISSSLSWKAIKVSDGKVGKAVQFVTQPYTSDIDHTGALSEAIVSLPQAVAPKGTMDLDISYEGVVLLDATRLTRIGTPEDVAKSTDWDQIDTAFTGLRGAGYVAWYPIATESANLSESDLFEVLGRWKAREAGSQMHLRVSIHRTSSVMPQVIFGGLQCSVLWWEQAGLAQLVDAECLTQKERLSAPSLLISEYQILEKQGVELRFLKGHEVAAATFADTAENVAPFIADWFGKQRERAKVADLPDPKAAPFESGAFLLMSLTTDRDADRLAAAHQLAHVSFLSFRPWIEEGLAHFAQALYLEHENNRRVALEYMGLHRAAFLRVEESKPATGSDEGASRALVNTTSDELYRSKAMCVWWMLRDMVGDAALKKAFAAYRAEDDNDPSYMPRLITAQTQRDLGWFFDDWVYHDRGLPDFKVASAFSQATATNSFMVTITVENLGTAGAEVPIIVRSGATDVSKRLEVRAKSRATIRVEVPRAPQEIVVNDGSVPESDLTNNTFKVEAGRE